MKPLVKRVLEAGLVDKHTAQMLERWGQLDQGAADLVGQKQLTEKTLTQFVEELDELMETEKETYKQTTLDVFVTSPPITLTNPNGDRYSAIFDEMGHLLINPKLRLIPGDILLEEDGEGVYTILEVEKIFRNERVVALMVTVEK